MDRRRRDGWIVLALGVAALVLAFWLAAPLFDEPGKSGGFFLFVVLGCLILVGGGVWLLRSPPPRIL